MNILYIGSILCTHDIKWVKYFSSDTKNNIFFLDGSGVSLDDIPDGRKTDFIESNITILPPIQLFSLKRINHTYRYVRILRKYIKDNNIDIIHLLYAAPHAIWGIYLKRPFVITTRGSDVLITIPELKRKKPVLFRLFKRSFKKAAAITSTSISQVNSIHHYLIKDKECTIVNTGVDVDRINNFCRVEHLPEELKDKKFILFPRYMKPVYNHELEVGAIKHLDKEIIKDYKMVFIRGINYDKHYLHKIKEELDSIEGLDYYIIDYLTQENIFSCYKSAAVTVMVPHSDGSSVTALELMAAKKPIIIGRANYDKKIYDGVTLRITNNSHKELSELITKAIYDYPEFMIEEGFERVKKYGDRKVQMEKINAIYKNILMSN